MTGQALIIDDDESLRWIFSEVFEQAGFSVKTAENGFDAKNLILRQNFDVIVSDNFMPKTKGSELLRWLRNNPKNDVPFILMSGDELPEMTSGYSAFLRKPLDSADLPVLAKIFIKNHAQNHRQIHD